ncbi:hypothetical protein C5Y96_15325 [Blastopirellula marina]|uniref:DUF5673 domain-containing protein n=1 Tax=Blastopirellula marina TaxID=124 RepID=A0A2S8FAD0_9BACT|nr:MULTISPECIES: hypothetical protein [Pirellulaceae]PQO29123.1 hypothetical protein C5Y96_15325 [Blastopirellula marina]RCS50314.1 hypothetical protein DTL36_15335 [Bremerella cremea]
MSTDPASEPELELELELLDERPQQFGLIHLMGLMTVLAFAFALLAPLFRILSGRQVTYIALILVIELFVVGGSYYLASYRRNKLLSVSGRRVGQSNFGMAKSRAFGRLATVCGLLVFAFLQLALVILVICWMPDDHFPWSMLIVQFQMGHFATNAIMQLRWDRDYGAIEFFENGMADATMQFTPWERIVVRPSKLYEHGVNLHIKPAAKYGGAMMMTIFVSDPLKQYLLKHHGDLSPEKEAV